ncbi:protein-disulfide reductase DsbD [Sphingosinicella sp. CPCC 101087]|uniref:protein-disulfide reductase DsbD family protein n=1 Tax=Sphingosinicella sp. CPCC 101087 TaxID=2497754 RepID=UPI00101BA537|nr:thioredoxin family protein [Sphingosinicella sp. CPCC 101087]
MNRAGALLLFLVSLLCSLPAQAQNRMQVSLEAETETVVPGSEAMLAFVMRPEPGWHGYWLNPGDAGDSPRAEWRLPAGWTAGPLLYPVPDRLTLLGLMNYVYERDYALLATVQVPENAAAGDTVPVQARLDYLVCTDQLCVPETATVSTQLRIGAPGQADPAFSRYRQALPRPLGAEARFAIEGGRLRLAVPLPAAARLDQPHFYPLTLGALSHAAPQSLSRNGDLLIVETDVGRQAASIQSIEGVLETSDGIGLALTAQRGDVPAAGVPITTPAEPGQDGGPAILLALLGALAGGLLLNVMPCVFPILSLKALSLVRAGETEAAARREALAYAGGVIAICLLLGGLLLALRAGGAMVGWAFQLQDPRVILLLLLLVTAVALNLAGLFALPTIAGGHGLARGGGVRGAFFTGALAAFVATPCTGPFLGFALGAALVLPTWAALAVFAGLGLGLALPFLLLGFVPALRRRLPKPGAWMERFQRILSVPMFLTALGLAWILGRQSGVDGMALGLAAALVLGLALWWLGRRQDRARAWLPLAMILIAVLAPLPFVRTVEAGPVMAEGGLASEPFSEARLAELRAAGSPVFVYFTADWCLTCKVNERAVLDQAEVAAAFRQRGVRVLVGDWTRGDAAIGRFLESHGRSGVPLYLYYAPGGEAEILPQILTVGRVTSLSA